MSRIGQATIKIPDGIEVKHEGNNFFVKGSKGELTAPVSDTVNVTIKDGTISVEPKNKDIKSKAIWGTTRALINNAVSGVSAGFAKDMEIVGVGYRGALQGKTLSLSLGLRHPVEIEIPEGILVTMDGNTKFTISGADKQRSGAFAALLRSKRPPEPFKGNGIRYANDFVLRTEGTTT